MQCFGFGYVLKKTGNIFIYYETSSKETPHIFPLLSKLLNLEGYNDLIPASLPQPL